MKECCYINETIKEFYNSIYAYTLKKTGDKHVAEDIVQDVMYRLTTAYRNNIKIDNLRAWLYQTTRHVIADYFRQKNKSLECFSESDSDKEFPGVDIDLMVTNSIIPMIKLLPDEYAIPLLWSDIENIPQKEIALKLKISLSATKMRIQRARKKLYQLFMECCDIVYNRNGNFVHCTPKETCEPLLHLDDF